MPYSHDRKLSIGIFYMHYHIDMITNDTAVGEPVGGTGVSKTVTHRWQVNCQSTERRWGESPTY